MRSLGLFKLGTASDACKAPYRGRLGRQPQVPELFGPGLVRLAVNVLLELLVARFLGRSRVLLSVSKMTDA